MPGFEYFGAEERQEVQDVLDSGILFRYGFDQARNGHWKARSFETELAGRLGAKYCHLCSSGTAALSTALAACGIGAGDEVIIPPFTFVATFESLLNAGVVPVFAEIDETLCLNPEGLESVLSARTRAVMPVHMCGAMAQIDAITDFCRRKGLVLIEDACQSLGASFNGKPLGTFGQAGCFSFDFVKTITCGEGGAIVTNDQQIYTLAHAFSDHGHDHIGNDRGLEQHPILGANYRISELNAAIGLAQLRKLDQILARQRDHKAALKETLQTFPPIRFRRLPDPEGDSATFLSFFLPRADEAQRLAEHIGKAGIDGVFYWYANNWHYFKNWQHLKLMQVAARLPAQLAPNLPDYSRISCPQSDEVISRTISMLIKLSWTPEELRERCDKLFRAVTEFYGSH